MRLALTVGHDAQRKRRELENLQMQCIHRPFGQWHCNSFYQILDRNRRDIESRGVSIHALLQSATPRSRGSNSMTSLQKRGRAMICASEFRYNAEYRIRSKVQRWKLEGPDSVIARRILRNFNYIGKACKPCVLSTFLRTLWNGWPTSWRMRTATGASQVRTCLLGCSHAVDKIEHYLVCPFVWQVLPVFPGIELGQHRRTLQAMLLAAKNLSEEEIIAIANSVYAIAKTVQAIKIEECQVDPSPLLRLFLRDACLPSSSLMRRAAITNITI